MTPYRENWRGTSALPYHVMAERDKNIDIEVFSFNFNSLPQERTKETEQELNIKIHILPIPKWILFILRHNLVILRFLLRYPLHHYVKLTKKQVDNIKKLNPNGIWIYGEEMSAITCQFPDYRRIHTTVDCTSLYYQRLLNSHLITSKWDKVKAYINFKKFYRLESHYPTTCSNKFIKYHLVGIEDKNFLKKHCSNADAYFIHHPHYEINSQSEEIIFHSPIRILIAGKNDIYMEHDANKLIKHLAKNGIEIKDKYKITFLGKGWELHTKALQEKGWNATHIAYAKNYIEEIIQHDIQITPICIGTGTKGKVLDALANGLLVIGSSYALENISCTPYIIGQQIDPKENYGALQYNAPEDITELLKDILANTNKYEQMAKKGQELVLKEHNREKVAKQFFNLFK